jgi:hypothetical protein
MYIQISKISNQATDFLAWFYACSCLKKHKNNLMYTEKLSQMAHTHRCKETLHQNCHPLKLLKIGSPPNQLLDHEDYGNILAN